LRSHRDQEAIESRTHLINWNKDDYAVADGNTRIGRISRSASPSIANAAYPMKWIRMLQLVPGFGCPRRALRPYFR